MVEISELLKQFYKHPKLLKLRSFLNHNSNPIIKVSGISGSLISFIQASLFQQENHHIFIVRSSKENAAYTYNDLQNLLSDKDVPTKKQQVYFFPSSYKKLPDLQKQDNTHILMRAEVIKKLSTSGKPAIFVSYPEAIMEKVVRKSFLTKNAIRVETGKIQSIDQIIDQLIKSNFERVDFVYEPGQFSLRGGLIDVYSFTDDFPFRIEFFDDEVESIRTFNPADQLSVKNIHKAIIIPNPQDQHTLEKRISVFDYFDKNTFIWFEDYVDCAETINKLVMDVEKETELKQALFISLKEFSQNIHSFQIINQGVQSTGDHKHEVQFQSSPQKLINKNFDLLIQYLSENTQAGIENIILSENTSQLKRLSAILEDLLVENEHLPFSYKTISSTLHEGFSDQDISIACFTDHQIFSRYHKFKLKERYSNKQAISLKELYNLKPGDYVTHIDHGIGRFEGLEKIINNGKEQESIRLRYKDGDLLYVNIHSLHRISKYSGKEGSIPSMNRLGSNNWKKLKERTKKKVKNIARDLIKLYADRIKTHGFQFQPDTYLQHELEASFFYEDTPDQLKATLDIKKDMESGYPMDRLICGDVGFGKTEVAIRAAFKAVADSKQVAVLVPTTILALQHYRTFSERLSEFPVKVDYINRFRSPKDQSQIKKEIQEGNIDILIGTHRLTSKDINFKDLGLLIIDEEQKFGVAMKEKIKQVKTNVDTLTLTATPIPRTLQFSLMGARDLSIINTPPANRYPVQTELHAFDSEIIKESITYEIGRGGQVFFIHNRIKNISEVADMIKKYVPGISVAIGHGQMEGKKLEKVMIDFINGKYDVLLSTTIVESGLDIPNVNTIIINEAQNYGLSDLHQLRGRVGRTNKKSFCYLLTPPVTSLTQEARQRLKALEEFSELGSGFNIAMRDLDIRGAGNILGAEQSGFISDIGFEMYHKILNEALAELKDEQFPEIQKDDLPIVRDCQIDTDLALMIPDEYITNIAERLSLYKTLDEISTEADLQEFEKAVLDRFGPLPKQARDLLEVVRLRWQAQQLGIEKLVLKNNAMKAYFIGNQEDPFYQSAQFMNIIRYAVSHPEQCTLKETPKRLSIDFERVEEIMSARNILESMHSNKN